MQTHTQQRWFVFDLACQSQKSLAPLRVGPSRVEPFGQPKGSFDRHQVPHLKTGSRRLCSQFLRLMKKCSRKVQRIVGGIAVLAVLEILFEYGRKAGIVNYAENESL